MKITDARHPRGGGETRRGGWVRGRREFFIARSSSGGRRPSPRSAARAARDSQVGGSQAAARWTGRSASPLVRCSGGRRLGVPILNGRSHFRYPFVFLHIPAL